MDTDDFRNASTVMQFIDENTDFWSKLLAFFNVAKILLIHRTTCLSLTFVATILSVFYTIRIQCTYAGTFIIIMTIGSIMTVVCATDLDTMEMIPNEETIQLILPSCQFKDIHLLSNIASAGVMMILNNCSFKVLFRDAYRRRKWQTLSVVIFIVAATAQYKMNRRQSNPSVQDPFYVDKYANIALYSLVCLEKTDYFYLLLETIGVYLPIFIMFVWLCWKAKSLKDEENMYFRCKSPISEHCICEYIAEILTVAISACWLLLLVVRPFNFIYYDYHRQLVRDFIPTYSVFFIFVVIILHCNLHMIKSLFKKENRLKGLPFAACDTKNKLDV